MIELYTILPENETDFLKKNNFVGGVILNQKNRKRLCIEPKGGTRHSAKATKEKETAEAVS